MDCDADVVLLKVTQLGHEPGIACHAGRQFCFFSPLSGQGAEATWTAVAPLIEDPARTYRKRTRHRPLKMS